MLGYHVFRICRSLTFRRTIRKRYQSGCERRVQPSRKLFRRGFRLRVGKRYLRSVLFRERKRL